MDHKEVNHKEKDFNLKETKFPLRKRRGGVYGGTGYLLPKRGLECMRRFMTPYYDFTTFPTTLRPFLRLPHLLTWYRPATARPHQHDFMTSTRVPLSEFIGVPRLNDLPRLHDLSTDFTIRSRLKDPSYDFMTSRTTSWPLHFGIPFTTPSCDSIPIMKTKVR